MVLIPCVFCWFVYLGFFLGLHPRYMEVPRLGAWIGAAGLRHSHGSAGSLTRRVRPGIQPISSWILVRFVAAEPWYPVWILFISLWVGVNVFAYIVIVYMYIFSSMPFFLLDSLFFFLDEFLFFFFFFLVFLGPHLRHVEVPSLGI